MSEDLSIHGQERQLYSKICKNQQCRRTFKSPSRNTEYCQDPRCQASRTKSAERAVKQKKVYHNERVRHLEETRARKESRARAINGLVIDCWACGNLYRLVDMECHHIDGNCLNRSEWNLSWVCVPCHSKISNGNAELNQAVAETAARKLQEREQAGWVRNEESGGWETEKEAQRVGREYRLCHECKAKKPEREVGICPEEGCEARVCRACLKEGNHSHAVLEVSS